MREVRRKETIDEGHEDRLAEEKNRKRDEAHKLKSVLGEVKFNNNNKKK